MSGVSREYVKDNESDWRLDKWFKIHFPGLSYGRLSKILRKGEVRVDGKRAKANFILAGGMEIRLPPLGKDERSINSKPKIVRRTSPEDALLIREMVVYQDESVIVLNKLPGLAVQGGTNTPRHIDGMLEVLQGDKEDKPKLVHRLDKDTSGVLLIARTGKAAKALTESFRIRKTNKIYWALVKGKPSQVEGSIQAPLDKEPGTRGERMAVSDNGRRAITDFRVMDSAAGTVTWMAFRPITGRTHQIRVHATVLCTPIIGDGKYAAREAFIDGPISKKLHLHARSIEIDHPDGGLLSVKAPLPLHMLESWGLFGFNDEDNSDPFEEVDNV
ncbi:MAG: RluA family pseudouridine synthase [Kordiimonadaceae bacterium]|jgi:23S rRNA pseudouridine955/2504/2580 synthase|nr:RluA family pseudouridine synthase [Kordiimonadaceae bacterium]MDC0082162.1 RluA family pseudouridine synthase [Emcibacteraceae bacterium]MBT6135614.1 RluA family pseudouridine synthase [Kordiimonadaceae bacterium]MBT6467236.1 RluA family pseudouridine synthase [Kordiimonadaceae bacterium]MBT7543912.1 RluA family pseudouridine synthase [Kordiimonadaceae bacterium]|tara:strand:+ start:5627 stop:6616 length:990 start_codon:yes stop_codon:yes gene_type:complete